METQSNSNILKTISQWLNRNLSDPEAIALLFTLLFGILTLVLFGKFLLPLIVGAIIAYLLAPSVRQLERWHLPHQLAVTFVYLSFLGVLNLILFWLLPILWKQLTALMHELPIALNKGAIWAAALISRYPKLFPDHYDPLIEMTKYLQEQSIHIGQWLLSLSLATIPSLIQVILYLVLIPLLVFFFLKDNKAITLLFDRYLPKQRGVIYCICHDINDKIGVYVRGRVFEVFIVSIVSSVVFTLLGLRYSVLLGFLLGLSAIIPYIGALAITFPIAIVSLMQWGLSAHFFYVITAFAIIIILDGNVLMPVLFSETMALHPVVIITSVLIFGGLWGFWGIFFAIPLATVFKTILDYWPQTKFSPELPEITPYAADKNESDSANESESESENID